jgi:hypothetical protein
MLPSDSARQLRTVNTFTSTDQANRTFNESAVNPLSVAGAICYVLWGCLHLWAAYTVHQVGAAVAPGMVRGRVFQDSWNLLFFGITAIVVALTLNVRNSAWGYWINLGILALADTGLILFVIVPGYMPLWPGLAGPVLWVLGGTLTTLAYLRRDSAQRH